MYYLYKCYRTFTETSGTEVYSFFSVILNTVLLLSPVYFFKDVDTEMLENMMKCFYDYLLCLTKL